MRITTKIRSGDWISVIKAINQLADKLGTHASPTFTTIELTGITDDTIPYSSSSGMMDSPLTTDGTNVSCSGYLDLTNITNSNIPYMSSSGFADSPLSTDATDVDCSGNFDLNDNEIQNVVIHNVADETARLTEDMVEGKVVYQVDTGISYLCTSY